MIRVWMAAWAVAALALFPAAAKAKADDAPAGPPQGAFVVVVGVGEFTDPAIQPRPTAEADARALYDLYADPAYSPAAAGRVILLTATPDDKRKARKATRENVVAALHEAVAKTGKDDTVIVAMFGRGASSGDQTCYFTAETNFKERAKTGMLGSDLEAEFKPAKDRKLCLMLDIAFRGFDAGKETLAEPGLRDVLTAVFGGEDKGGDQPPPQDKVVLLATVPASSPLAVGANGLFATTAIEALKGAADTDGYEPDGLVVVDELVKYVEKKIPEQARALGKTVEEKEAVPFIVGEETAHFALAKNPKLTAQVAGRVAAMAALEKAGKLDKEVADEGRKLLTRMPKLKGQQNLRREYQKLADATITPEAFATARAAIQASLKLPAEDADKYARTVMKAIDAVRNEYIKAYEPGEWAAFAVKGLYRRLEEPLADEVKATIQNPKTLTRNQIAEVLRDARTRLGKREDIEGVKDVDTTILMMFAELRDPYTTYYDAALIKKMDSQLRGEFRGVGIQIRRDLVRDGLLVVTPIKGSPAYKAGIRAGDLITGIKRDSDPEGKPLKADAAAEISTKGMKTEQALEVILGKPGVPVTLVVERDGQSTDYTIKRGVVGVETVLGVKRDESDEWTYFVDPDEKIGYVCLTQFGPKTAADLATAVGKMKAAGLKGLVLDLRFNPGGYLDSAVAISDLFLDGGVIVTVKSRTKKPQTLSDEGRAAETGFPMAVLVNGQSASAAEIVSAALQDYNRAVVVGERSYGKGSVQHVKPFDATGGEIKMTTARYFPPLGRNIDKLSTKGTPEEEWGVKPDAGYEVKLSREEAQDLLEHVREREVIKPPAKKAAKVFKDRQLEKAVEYLRGQTKTAKAAPAKSDG